MIKYVNDKSFPSKIVVQNSNELKFNPEENQRPKGHIALFWRRCRNGKKMFQDKTD